MRTVPDVRLPDSVDRSTAVTAGAAITIMASVALVAWEVYNGWFFGDDFEFLSDVALGKADVAWLFHRHNVHVMPLGFVLVWLTGSAGTFVWPVAATGTVLAFTAAGVACWWMLRTLFGHRAKALVPLVFFCFSPVLTPALSWWAAALNMVTCLPFLFVGVTAHVLLLRTGRHRWGVTSVTCLVLALGFYVKALLLPVVLVLLTVLYFTDGPWTSRVLRAARRWWWVWTAHAVVGLAFVAAYLSLGERPAQTDGLEARLVGDLVQRQLLANLVPSLLGGPWSWSPADLENGPRQLAAAPQAAQTAALVVVVAIVAYLALRYRGALRAVWLLVPAIVATLVLLAAGRLAVFGTAITEELRYWADVLPYLTLVLGLMTMPLRGSSDPLRERRPAVLAWRAPREAVAAAVALYAVSAAWSSITYVSTWHDDFQARTYLQTASAELGGRRVDVPLANEAVPQAVMQSLAYPQNLYDRILAPIGGFRTPEWANDMAVLDGGGHVRPGVAATELVVPDELLASCLRGEPGGTTRVDLGSTTFDYPFWASMTYRSDVTGDVRIRAGDRTHDARLLEGVHVLTFRTAGRFDEIELDLPAGSTLCIEALSIGKEVVPR